ncbi:Virion morphogenesis protein [Vibrio chagasii]|nr:Virion morphogenesis protein [Vibrio chagasii]
MYELTINKPEQLTQVVDRLVLSATDKFDLNKRMANRARQFFREQIRRQRDIDDNLYQSRTRRTVVNTRLRKSVKSTLKNKDMLLGLARALRTYITEDGFEVGLKGVTARIAREHNDGSVVSFTTRVNGFFDSKTGRWAGGKLTKRHYRMPKRTFLGWTRALEQELLAMSAEHFVQEDSV